MMQLPERPLPLLALLGIALALAIGHAAGSDPDPSVDEPIAEPVTRDRAATGAQRAQPVPTLALNRPKRVAGENPVATDIFSGRSWVPPPPPVPVAPPPPPPEPMAPALPYAYVGRMEAEDAKPIIYLSRGERLLAVTEGEVIDQDYRIESLTDNEIVLVYLPLGQPQTLRTGSERR